MSVHGILNNYEKMGFGFVKEAARHRGGKYKRK